MAQHNRSEISEALSTPHVSVTCPHPLLFFTQQQSSFPPPPHLLVPKSQTLTLPSWLPLMSSAWFGWRVTVLKGEVWGRERW